MAGIKTIQPIMDAAESLRLSNTASKDQQLKIVKQDIFKERETSKVKTDEIFTEILNEILTISSMSSELTEDEPLRLRTVENLIILNKFSQDFFSSHIELQDSLSEKVIQAFSQVITDVQKLPHQIKDIQPTVDLNPIDSTAAQAVEDLRATSEAIQSAVNYEEIIDAIQKAEEVNEKINIGSKEQRDRADLFIKAIQEKVHLFLKKEVSKFKTLQRESIDIDQTSELKGRLKKYQDLANDWSGSHKEHILEEITELFHKL